MYAESHSRGQKCNVRARPLNDGNVFSLTGVPIAKDAVLVEAGLDWRLTPAIRFGVEYQGELAATRANPHRQGQLHLGFLTAPPAWSALTRWPKQKYRRFTGENLTPIAMQGLARTKEKPSAQEQGKQAEIRRSDRMTSRSACP
jgi:hypothetical protein